MSRILEILEETDVSYRIVRHPAVHTIEEMMNEDIPEKDRIAKNLFLRDDKKRKYYLITVNKDRKIDLKQLRTLIASRPLSFASESDLLQILGLEKGAVTPFGIVHDENRKAALYIDSFFENGEIGVHPDDNTATVFLKTEDLINVLRPYCDTVSFLSL